MATCEFEYVPCKYHFVGCDVKMVRKDIAQHKQEKHLRLVFWSIAMKNLQYYVLRVST